MERALDTWRPDAVIFCAARADVDACETDPSTRAVNVDAPIAWARRVPTWYVSTNYVFSGPGPHAPDDLTAPMQIYGKQKIEAEFGIRKAGSHVVRTGWLYGPGGRTFLSRLPEIVAEGRSMRGITDVRVQPTWTPDLARFLIGLPEGINHAIGAEETTWYDMACEVARRLGCEPRIQPAREADMGFVAPRPHDARLTPALLPGWTARIDAWLAPISHGTDR